MPELRGQRLFGARRGARRGVRPGRGVAATALAVVVALALALPLAVPAAQAGWLSRIAGGAAEVGAAGAASKVTRLGLGSLERAAAHVQALTVGTNGAALAAHVTQEGHWKFVNKAGEVFTAGTREELARVVATLAPEAADAGTRLSLYITEATAFEGRAALADMLKELPKAAGKAPELRVVVNDAAYKLVRRGAGSSETLLAEVRPNIVVALDKAGLFDEAVWQLARPLNRANIRVLALEAGGPERLAGVPRFDAATKAAQVDVIDPYRLASALGAVRGQTVLVTGRVEGDMLRFGAAGDARRTLPLGDLVAAAERHDVNLVLLESEAARQPGGRNWLWQKVGVKGLDEAVTRATFADFLDALGATRGEMLVSATAENRGRVLVQAVPTGATTVAPSGGLMCGLTGGIADWMRSVTADWSVHVTGHLATSAVRAFTTDRSRQQELDARILPGLPSWVQWMAIGSFVCGLIGYRFAGAWFARLWPAERREEYSSLLGFRLAALTRLMIEFLIFLPVVGIPAFIVASAVGLWEQVTAPFRWWKARRAAKA